MNELKLIEGKNESKEELTLDNVRALLEDKNSSDEQLEKIINSIKIFCKVSYELYSEEQNKKEEQIKTNNIITLHSEPIELFKEAA